MLVLEVALLLVRLVLLLLLVRLLMPLLLLLLLPELLRPLLALLLLVLPARQHPSQALAALLLLCLPCPQQHWGCLHMWGLEQVQCAHCRQGCSVCLAPRLHPGQWVPAVPALMDGWPAAAAWAAAPAVPDGLHLLHLLLPQHAVQALPPGWHGQWASCWQVVG